MMGAQFLAVGIGAVLGAWLRWGLNIWLGANSFALGTLVANLLGGFLMGVALNLMIDFSSQNVVRLAIMTGFLGGLTTFSSFSAESFLLLQKGDFLTAILHTFTHVLGALVALALGYSLVQLLKS